MVMNPILQYCNVHMLILDTTYCDSQYDFPKQETVTQFVLVAIQAKAFNPETLFWIGTYTIGKERTFLQVAKVLRKKVYVGSWHIQTSVASLLESTCRGYAVVNIQ